MSSSRFDALNEFIRKRRRWIIICWVVVLLISLTFIPSFFSSVSYNITGGIGGPTNTESQKAANILAAEFPGSSNSSTSSILVVYQGSQVYADPVKNSVLALNSTIAGDRKIANYTGMNSLYNIEYGLLKSSLPSLLPAAATLQSNISRINDELYSLQSNLSSLSVNLFSLEKGINQTSQLVYGIPAGFVQAWEGVEAHGISNPYQANELANSSLYQATDGFGGNAESIAYYTIFFQSWNSSFASSSQGCCTPIQREAISVNQSAAAFLSNPQINNETKQIVATVSRGLNLTNWNQTSSIENLTVSTLASSIPPQLSSSLGVSPTALLTSLYDFGPAPSNSTLGYYAVQLFAAKFSNSTSPQPGIAGLSVPQLLNSSYALGTNPSSSLTKHLASELIANVTASTFASSPLFSVNATSLKGLLSGLPSNASAPLIQGTIDNVVANQSFSDYPYLPSRSLTQNFVSRDNSTMIVIFNFSSQPAAGTIKEMQNVVENSMLSSLGKTYVTGASVISQDVQNVFTPALSITIGPGVAISILIVGLLFLSPVAALIPIFLGGMSIAIALPTVYLGIVVLGHGTITFLTPTLTILLILGLSVDYAVLQMRRTREERLNGKSTEESVGISVKWAGQAVLTAGITVITAYIVMAVANVPLFSDVGTAIALGVSILLAISLTLLPALELSLKDQIFWPAFSRRVGTKSKSTYQESRLDKLGRSTLRRKVAIAVIISALALGAFYTGFGTPTGGDFLKLIPNFPSNQGLTVIAQKMGSGTIAPVTVILTTPTPIVYGNSQFNQTLLNQIELISDSAGNSSGVLSVAGPTRPYGSVFNYSSIDNMSEHLRVQYESGILATIGKDNKTALVTVGLSSSSESQSAINSLLAMEKNIQKLPLKSGESLYFGGDTQATYDSQAFLDGLLPEVILILAAAVYVILLVQLRSAFTPLRLIFTILCSVAFSLSILSLVFYHGLDLPILDFAPLFVIVTMLGVGIDYDIFFVTRIREEVLRGKTDNEAIVTAVDKVWVTILGLGLVLSTVFGSLIITGIAILQEIGLVVAAAILIDVLVVILFFVPSLMGLAQSWNWWPSKIRKAQVTQPEK